MSHHTRSINFVTRSRRWLAPASLVLSAVLLTACYSQAASDQAMPAPSVSIMSVAAQPIQPWEGFTGRVAAVDSVELRARVSGYIDHVAFTEGQTVSKGDLLFVIDARPYRAALDQAQAELARARSNAQFAVTQQRLAKVLVQSKAISREEFDSRNASASQALAAVRAAEATVAAASLDLQYTEVRSPITGRASRAFLTTGNLAQANQTVLTTVVSQDPVHVLFDVDESTWLRYARQARDGQRSTTQSPVQVGLASDEMYPHAGYVDFIDNHVDPATGTLRARAVLPNPDGVLTPGLFARVQLGGSQAYTAMLIDEKAVLTDQDRKYVLIVDQDNRVQRRDIALGPIVQGLRVIKKGLAEGDRVVVSGHQKVPMPGMAVSPTLVDSPAVAQLLGTPVPQAASALAVMPG